MRKMEITEVDSGCYVIRTTDFQDSDSAEYTWDRVSDRFECEYQMGTMEKRRFQKDRFVFADYPTIGAAIDFIWKHDSELCEARWNARIQAARPSRVIDVIIV